MRSARQMSRVVFAIAMSAATTRAAEQRLADLSYVGHHDDHGSVIVDTSGPAKLRLSFVAPGTARVQIATNGTFAPNVSTAVEDLSRPALADTTVVDNADALLVRNGGLTLRVDKRHLRVDAFDGEQPISIEAQTTWDDANGAIAQARTLADAERIYGLGQDNANHGTLDRRGTTMDLWTGQQIRSGNVTADYPVSFYLSTGRDGRGYGAFVDSSWHLKFDVGKTRGDQLTWAAPGGPIDYFLFAGPSFKTIVDRYTQLTGRPSMLPLWAFGFWQSRCFYQASRRSTTPRRARKKTASRST